MYFRKYFELGQYLVGFWNSPEISDRFKKNLLEKLISPVERSALPHASNFDRRNFFDLNDVSIVFS